MDINEQEIKTLFDKWIKDYATQNQYGVSKIPVHSHTGTDSPQINKKDITGFDTYVADGQYTVGAKLTVGGDPGKITTKGGLITAIQQAS